jgi:hypothetical protein
MTSIASSTICPIASSTICRRRNETSWSGYPSGINASPSGNGCSAQRNHILCCRQRWRPGSCSKITNCTSRLESPEQHTALHLARRLSRMNVCISAILLLYQAFSIQWTILDHVSVDGRREDGTFDKITARITKLCSGLNPDDVDAIQIAQKVLAGMYPGVPTSDLDEYLVGTATQRPGLSRLH